MTKNNSIYFGDVEVTETRKSFKVNLEMVYCVLYIDKEMVKEIASNNQEDENLIAIILAYIEYARKSKMKENNNKIENRILVCGLSQLLVKYPAENIIDGIRFLKWHEICRILSSDDPTKEIEEFI